MKKIIFAIVLASALPALATAEMKMQNSNPSPTVAPEHVMQNTNPSPAQAPEHVMKNTNPNSSNSGDNGGVEATKDAVDIQHLKKEK
jgi:Tfp pilus assembly protein PilX